jgi:hypothetical protein
MEVIKLYLSVIGIMFAIAIPSLGVLLMFVRVRAVTKNSKKTTHDRLRY